MRFAPVLLFTGLLLVTGLSRAGAQSPRLDTRADPNPNVRRLPDGSVVFRNRHLVAVLPRGEQGYGRIELYPTTRPTQPGAAPIAEVPRLLQITTGAGDESEAVTPTFAQASLTGGNRVTFTGPAQNDAGGWEVDLELWIGGEAWLSWEIRARAVTANRLVRLAGPTLQSVVSGPSTALFPGVTLVEGGQGGAVASGGILVPDPLKVTVPTMALAHRRTTVGMLWDARQDWGQPGNPTALYALPTQPGEPYRMELSVPPAALKPGGSTPLPAAPVTVAARKELRFEGKLLVLPEEERVSAAVRQWTLAFGLPSQSGFPRNMNEARVTTRTALTDTLWRAGAAGWYPAVPAGRLEARADPAHILALWMDAGLSRSSKLKEQAQQAVAKLATEGPLPPVLAYRLGGVLPGLAAERRRVYELIDEQLPGGYWAPESSEPLPGPFAPRVEIGHLVRHLLPMLKYAATTGDSHVVGSAIRALNYAGLGLPGRESGRFRRPLGARPQDVPLDTPDLLASAMAAEAYLLGYRTTGESRYLEAARNWADTGLSFVYFWENGTRPAMRFAAVPLLTGDPEAPAVASATIGLIYARVLRHLSQVRKDGLYDFLSEGILSSALSQQSLSGEGNGLLPAGWNIRENRAEGIWTTPLPLLDMVYAIQGYDTLLSHHRNLVGPDRLFVTSGAMIQQTSTTATRLRLKLKWMEHEETITTIAGVPARPLRVEYNGSPYRVAGFPIIQHFLAERGDDQARGWTYDPESRLLTLRLRHTGGADHVEIRWPDSRERFPIDRPDNRIRTDR
ncbi:MAG: hypothetical protein FJX77_03845 [Armatimonadetes bacterium]|nr:hypothetical protein [Armatimonadota bacterium]